MYSDVNHSDIAGSPSLPAVSTSLAQEPSAVGAGRSVAVVDKEIEKTVLLHDLPEELTLKIFRFLELRDIVSLQQVSTHLNRFIKNEHVLERTWYGRFSLSHQYQLKKSLPVEDKEHLRNWLRPFTRDQALVESLITHREAVYFPALFHFAKARLMSQYETYNVDIEAVIAHDDKVNSATFSVDGRHLVTASDDATAIIYGQRTDGTWEKKGVISHDDVVK
ncbi:F-box-like domain-containing protein [Endozoicomonas sp. 2B-B]